MIDSARSLPDGARLRAGLVVVGAGPAGIVTALEAADRGVDVVLVESGGSGPDAATQTLSAAHLREPDLHAPVELTVSRQLGGTSAIWGGRCVPFDPIDFEERDERPGSRWPIGHDDVAAYADAACDWLHCGRAVFDSGALPHLPTQLIPGLPDGRVRTSDLERWSLPTDFGAVYRDRLRATPNLRVLTDATCVRIDVDLPGERATGIACRTPDGHLLTVVADDVALAGGGLETTRLLLASPGADGAAIGDHSGHLGRWYQAHLDGVVADLVLDPAPDRPVHDYERDRDGSYVRRRFTFTADQLREHGLPNIAGWIANPELPDAAHRSGVLSLVYLILLSPLGPVFAPPAQRSALTGVRVPGTPYGQSDRSPVWRHLWNVLRDLRGTVRFALDFGVRRTFARGRKPPGFFVAAAQHRYPFQYHAEHLPDPDSRVTLSDEVDAAGMPRLDVDIRFSATDVAGVLAAHRHWDAYLREHGVGRLELQSDDPAAAVLARTGGGFHQVGTTRMSADPGDGVVDEHLAVHGVPNVHVVSSSVFVTSGQANPTFLVVALALRLVDHLYGAAPHRARPGQR